jgi:hypothetical protein
VLHPPRRTGATWPGPAATARQVNELEQRVAILEALFVAVAPWFDPQVLDDAEADLRGGLEAVIDGDERVIRLPALSLIEDARKRFQGPAPGVVIR